MPAIRAFVHQPILQRATHDRRNAFPALPQLRMQDALRRASTTQIDERVAEPHMMLAPRELMKMADIEVWIVIAVEREDALQFGERCPLRRRHAAPSVEHAEVRA
jgi:hypothetical protein